MNNEKEKLKYEAPWLVPVVMGSSEIVAGESLDDSEDDTIID